MTKIKSTRGMRKFTIDLGTAGSVSYMMNLETVFDDWPLEMKLECLNTILILNSLGMISPQVFDKKYKPLVEKYAEDLQDLLQFVK